ncbi:glucose-1-phosphate thymidylyltransferase [Thermodesulfobacteriota bacterium]
MERSISPESKAFFDFEGLNYRDLFDESEYVWKTLDRLKEYLAAFFQEPWSLSGVTGQVEKPLVIHEGRIRDDVEVKAVGPKGAVRTFVEGEALEGAAVILPGAYLFDDRVILGPGTVVEPGALIKGPTVIGANSEVRQGAYIRGDCLVGDGCVVGHTTEMKASIMLDGAKAGHFAYIGDSILGRDVNMGAGTKLANLKMIPGTVIVGSGRDRFDTRRRKLGAILGDRTETGCNSVTSPGTLMGPRSIVYPCMAVAPGLYPGRTIFSPPHRRPPRKRGKK